MAYNIQIADKIREALSHLQDVEEKNMFGGIAFMVNGKMCMGVMKGEMMCRIDPAREEEALQKRGARQMDFTGRPMKGYILVEPNGFKSVKDLSFWVDLCLDFNKRAKTAKKSKRM